MRDGEAPLVGLDSFWIEADVEECGDHPLERELCYRIDSVARYRRMIDDADAEGRDEMVDSLLSQHERAVKLVRELQEALRKCSRPS